MAAPTWYIVANVVVLAVSSTTAGVLYWRLRRQWKMTEALRAFAARK